MPDPSHPSPAQIRPADWVSVPNLLSLVRVVLVIPVAVALAQETVSGTLWALALLALAGITDALDGYIARRWSCETTLGLILDPLADKLLATFLVIALIFYRDFPIWLALVIVGRDLAILAAGLLVLRRRRIALQSNLIGKYTFFSLLLLLGFWIIRFAFGSILFTWISVLLIGLTLISYGKSLRDALRGHAPKPSSDSRLAQLIRVSVTAMVLLACLVMLIKEKTTWLG